MLSNFQVTMAEILGRYSNHSSYQTSLTDFVKSLAYDRGRLYYDGLELPDSPKNQMLGVLGVVDGRDKGKAYSTIFNDSEVSARTRLSLLSDKADARNVDITVRMNDKEVVSVSEGHQTALNNSEIARQLIKMHTDGVLPGDVAVHRHTFDSNLMHLRLVAPQTWVHQNGHTYYGGLVVSNDQRGTQPFTVAPALANVSCFNYTLRKVQYETRQFDNTQVVADLLTQGVSQVSQFSIEMFNLLQEGKNIQFANASEIFEFVSSRMRLPGFILDAAREWFVKQGRGATLYDVIEAFTWASQYFTDNTGRRRPRFEARDDMENQLSHFAFEVHSIYNSGGNVNNLVDGAALIKRSKVLQALKDSPDLVKVQALTPDAYR